MANRQYRTLNKRMVDRLSVDGKDAVFWDRGLPGFGVRVYPTGAKVFVVQTYAFGRSKRVTLGRYGPKYFVDHAREDAKQVIACIKAGESPVPVAAAAEPTVRLTEKRNDDCPPSNNSLCPPSPSGQMRRVRCVNEQSRQK